jgi:hypothetical protein
MSKNRTLEFIGAFIILATMFVALTPLWEAMPTYAFPITCLGLYGGYNLTVATNRIQSCETQPSLVKFIMCDLGFHAVALTILLATSASFVADGLLLRPAILCFAWFLSLGFPYWVASKLA